MNFRRSAAVLAAAALTGAVAAPVAHAADPSPSASLPAALYGTADPTYDGVWRQSLALLAQDTVGVTPAAEAVTWLTGQQCADGSFAPYRADTGEECDAKTAVDTNNTAAAVQALAALGGHDAVTTKAVGWLKSVQNADGGWGYTPGSPSDANSTSVVIGALAAVGEKPGETVKGGKSPYDALLGLSLPCGADGGGGAFAYQPDEKGKLAANDDATAAAVVGALGKGLTGASPKPDGTEPTCAKATGPEQAARNGAAHLLAALGKEGHLMSALPGAEDQPDYGNTADAVLALATAGHADEAADAMRWLGAHYQGWAKQSGPAAYAQLILAADAAGFDVHDFGGSGDDLVERLNATGPAPKATEAATEAKDEAEAEDDDSGFGVWWTVGVFLVAGIGIGFLISGRRKSQP
ncbi:prenyltransferase/squalene oxidase repeat-containing protein [Streptomyces flavalbus]|uniref:Prenyltransferase/squalene oxidase repeat-containing protein n=1 Tax=Streptomyces flavalbus TaxID=2665155 RepID=A0ABW2W821_9ACTN